MTEMRAAADKTGVHVKIGDEEVFHCIEDMRDACRLWAMHPDAKTLGWDTAAQAAAFWFDCEVKMRDLHRAAPAGPGPGPAHAKVSE